jgi:hypothetical protein
MRNPDERNNALKLTSRDCRAATRVTTQGRIVPTTCRAQTSATKPRRPCPTAPCNARPRRCRSAPRPAVTGLPNDAMPCDALTHYVEPRPTMTAMPCRRTAPPRGNATDQTTTALPNRAHDGTDRTPRCRVVPDPDEPRLPCRECAAKQRLTGRHRNGRCDTKTAMPSTDRTNPNMPSCDCRALTDRAAAARHHAVTRPTWPRLRRRATPRATEAKRTLPSRDCRIATNRNWPDRARPHQDCRTEPSRPRLAPTCRALRDQDCRAVPRAAEINRTGTERAWPRRAIPRDDGRALP